MPRRNQSDQEAAARAAVGAGREGVYEFDTEDGGRDEGPSPSSSYGRCKLIQPNKSCTGPTYTMAPVPDARASATEFSGTSLIETPRRDGSLLLAPSHRTVCSLQRRGWECEFP